MKDEDITDDVIESRDVKEDSIYAHKFAVMQKQIDKKDIRIKELEEENGILEFQNKQLENYVEELKKYNKTVSDRIVEYKKNSIPKQKVKDVIKDIKLSGGSNGKDDIENLVRELIIDVLEELLEDK